jgi:hypothetical protein
MERTKLLLTLAPVVALVVAVAYLQGYWGYYGILVFPYLSFNEILAYSAAPLFGFVLASSLGIFFGILNATTQPPRPTNIVHEVVEVLLLGSLCVSLVYLDRPEKWYVVPLAALGFMVPYLVGKPWVRDRIKEAPSAYLAGIIAVFLVSGTFGWGRSEAQRLAQTKTPSVQALVDGNLVNARLLGKINAYYFFLGSDGKVTQYQESTVKRITYEKLFPGG